MAGDEQVAVHSALRFGWAFAETRGRLRMGPPKEAPPNRGDHALPLAEERTWLEQTIEVQAVVCSLACELGVNEPLGEDGIGVERELTRLAKALGAARKNDLGNAEVGVRWNDLSEFLYRWDARTQDALAARSFAVASAYQLGRGLAEVYWALDLRGEESPGADSPGFLLGAHRIDQLNRLLARLAPFFPPATTSAIQASLGAWAHLAGAERLSAGDTAQLHEQIRTWRDALLIGQKPVELLGPQQILRRGMRVGPILRAFRFEAWLGVAGMVAACGAVALFALGADSPIAAPLLAAVSFFGLTSAGALAKAKNQAHALFDELQHVMNAELLREALTLPPARSYLPDYSGRAR